MTRPVLSYHYYSYPSLTTVGAADEKIDWRMLKSHLILLSLIKGRVSGLKHYQRLAPLEGSGMRNRAALGGSHPIHSSRQTPRINSSPASPWRTGARPSFPSSEWVSLWLFCADRRAQPSRRSLIYFTVFHLQTTTNLHQREIRSVYPIGVI